MAAAAGLDMSAPFASGLHMSAPLAAALDSPAPFAAGLGRSVPFAVVQGTQLGTAARHSWGGGCTPGSRRRVAADPGMGLVRAAAAFPRTPQGKPYCGGRKWRNGADGRDPRKVNGVGSKRRGLLPLAAGVAAAVAAAASGGPIVSSEGAPNTEKSLVKSEEIKTNVLKCLRHALHIRCKGWYPPRRLAQRAPLYWTEDVAGTATTVPNAVIVPKTIAMRVS